MKTYYLVAEKGTSGSYTVSVQDNPRNNEILKEFEAENFSAAVKQYSFIARNMGKSVFCGIAKDGNPYHGEA